MIRRTSLLLLAIAWTLSQALPAIADAPLRTRNVVIVTLDGFRWQEVFTGADETLLDAKAGGVKELDALKRRYWKPSAVERRETLLPFFWGTIAKQGQVFGDPSREAAVKLTNGLKFSYPGYSELFCGFADPRIDSNDKRPNPNLSVLEFLNGQPACKDRVAAFCTWDVFPSIFRSGTNGLRVQAGWLPIQEKDLNERQRAINAMADRLPRYWPGNAFDIVTMEAAQAHLQKHKPRVLFIGLGETDEWGHGRRYDLYLDAARNSDRFLAELWQQLQELPDYKDQTTLIVTTDHGRGSTRTDWTDHGKNVPGAEWIWIAVLGPDTPALGVREKVAVTQSQVAATIARLLGEDFSKASPKSAPPLPVGFKGS